MPVAAKDFFVKNAQTASEAQTESYSMGSGFSPQE